MGHVLRSQDDHVILRHLYGLPCNLSNVFVFRARMIGTLYIFYWIFLSVWRAESWSSCKQRTRRMEMCLYNPPCRRVRETAN
jgi:hypothetical protein